ncbi:hypothetical protein [Adlercreutzia muris]|uniref:Uncharacterized protein n=1 Tax=Adlercreutzia muris TaxID=1796610 RepID=A0A7C8BRI5_9ACTN|nr:hypothetical protein [Adlercreutzia muris]KAB1647966.1 hypothetical protein F8D48_06650 [Adlercreutzia muris]MCR2027744.1 hypothetical protein [Adlercreutzia muris]
MTEEKKSPEGLNVIIESDGDWREVIGGTLCLVAVVGDDGTKSYAYGAVSTIGAYAVIDAASRQIGAVADKAGIGADAAKAIACDCIAKQMCESRSERAAGLPGNILAGIDRECGGCPDFASKESAGS